MLKIDSVSSCGRRVAKYSIQIKMNIPVVTKWLATNAYPQDSAESQHQGELFDQSVTNSFSIFLEASLPSDPRNKRRIIIRRTKVFRYALHQDSLPKPPFRQPNKLQLGLIRIYPFSEFQLGKRNSLFVPSWASLKKYWIYTITKTSTDREQKKFKARMYWYKIKENDFNDGTGPSRWSYREPRSFKVDRSIPFELSIQCLYCPLSQRSRRATFSSLRDILYTISLFPLAKSDIRETICGRLFINLSVPEMLSELIFSKNGVSHFSIKKFLNATSQKTGLSAHSCFPILDSLEVLLWLLSSNAWSFVGWAVSIDQILHTIVKRKNSFTNTTNLASS